MQGIIHEKEKCGKCQNMCRIRGNEEKKHLRTQKVIIKTTQQIEMGQTTDICLRHKGSFQSRLLQSNTAFKIRKDTTSAYNATKMTSLSYDK